MPARQSSAPRYKIVPIGNPRPWLRFFPFVISPNGRCIAGNTVTRWGNEARWSVTLWKDGVFTSVADEQERHMAVSAVNDTGDIVGRVPLIGKAPWHAIVCRPATATFERLLADAINSEARTIDNAGNIYGVHYGHSTDFAPRAFVKRSDSVVDFPDTDPDRHSFISVANEKQQVLLELFTSNPKGQQRGIWNAAQSGSPLQDIFFELQSLVPEHSCRAFSMNNHGDVVGFGEIIGKKLLPVLWRRGTTEPIPLLEDREGIGDDINDHGDIIGKLFRGGPEGQNAPFLIHQGKFHLLNDLVDSTMRITTAQRVLNDGSILATVHHKQASPLDRRLPWECEVLRYNQTVLLKPR